MSEGRRNWAGNYTFRAARIHQPTTLAEVQALVAGRRHVRALGAGHSFNAIADSPGDLISLARLDRVVALDPARRTVTVEAGIRYGPLCRQLHRAGYALPNLASLPHVTVAGACATGTHGSGDRNGVLATAVAALDLVAADGTLVTLTRERDGERFLGAVVGLGALGVVARLTLDLVPAFTARQDVYEGLPLERLAAHFDAIMASGYSVSLFTDWRDGRCQVWLKRRVDDREDLDATPDAFGATPATRERHPIAHLPADDCTAQLGVPGPWHERLPHFRLEGMPSSGAELQSEYLVPRRHARAALGAVAGLRDNIAPLLQIAEVRTVAADSLWLSPCYAADSVALHFTWAPDWSAVGALLPRLEDRLAPFAARPHWGKLFATPPARLRALYPKLPAFQALMRDYDPAGKFRNAFLDATIFGAP
ncbi:MAG TPA: FAD-binding protein [Thermomicrobiales bacterium]|nr:FAD-binding protein [Thermomicrobiales bacterium]